MGLIIKFINLIIILRSYYKFAQENTEITNNINKYYSRKS